MRLGQVAGAVGAIRPGRHPRHVKPEARPAILRRRYRELKRSQIGAPVARLACHVVCQRHDLGVAQHDVAVRVPGEIPVGDQEVRRTSERVAPLEPAERASEHHRGRGMNDRARSQTSSSRCRCPCVRLAERSVRLSIARDRAVDRRLGNLGEPGSMRLPVENRSRRGRPDRRGPVGVIAAQPATVGVVLVIRRAAAVVIGAKGIRDERLDRPSLLHPPGRRGDRNPNRDRDGKRDDHRGEETSDRPRPWLSASRGIRPERSCVTRRAAQPACRRALRGRTCPRRTPVPARRARPAAHDRRRGCAGTSPTLRASRRAILRPSARRASG